MKRFIRTTNDRFFKLEELMYVGQINEKYPQELTINTRFDEEGKPLPVFYFDMLYKETTITPEYDDIEEAYQDREDLLRELNDE